MIVSPEFSDKDRMLLQLKGDYSTKFDVLSPPHALFPSAVSRFLLTEFGLDNTGRKLSQAERRNLRKFSEEYTGRVFDLHLNHLPNMFDALVTWFNETYDSDTYSEDVLMSAAIGMSFTTMAFGIMKGSEFFQQVDRCDPILLEREIRKVIIPEENKYTIKERFHALEPFPSDEEDLNRVFVTIAEATTRGSRMRMAIRDGASSMYWFLREMERKTA